MTALIAWFLANPTVLAIIAGIVGALGFGLQQRRAGAKSERNRQRAKEADSLEHSLQELANANRARNRVDPDSVPEHDKYRRD